jgi:hypothetical protein
MGKCIPVSVHEAAREMIRSGTTPSDIAAEFGITYRTAFRWLAHMRSAGEEVSFLRDPDRTKSVALSRLSVGTSLKKVSEQIGASEAAIVCNRPYRCRLGARSSSTPQSPQSPPERKPA